MYQAEAIDWPNITNQTFGCLGVMAFGGGMGAPIEAVLNVRIVPQDVL